MDVFAACYNVTRHYERFAADVPVPAVTAAVLWQHWPVLLWITYSERGAENKTRLNYLLTYDNQRSGVSIPVWVLRVSRHYCFSV